MISSLIHNLHNNAPQYWIYE